ncbi:hypothetical protein [Desulfurobacterium crinifex]
MDFKVPEEILSEAEREGSAREFFFKLLELLSERKLKRREIKKIPKEEQERIIYRIVKENQLDEFFSPGEAKNIYSALRRAFRKKKLSETEKEWERRLSDWRSQFEDVIKKASVRYLLEAGNRGFLKELFLLDWIVPSDIVQEFPGEPKEFSSWISKRSDEKFLTSRLENWLKLEAFRKREKILRDILKAYQLNCIELGIYGLFPQTEGVIWDTIVKGNVIEADLESLIRKRNRKFVTIQYAMKLIIENIFGKGEIPGFLDWVRFVDYREGSLNRHAIQHGVAVGFGTKGNFLKLFLFLDFLAEIISYIKCSEPS